MKMSKIEWALFAVTVLLMISLGFLLGEVYHQSVSDHEQTAVTEEILQQPATEAPTTEAPTEPSTEEPTTEEPTTEEPTTEAPTEDPNSPKFDAESLELALNEALANCDGKWAIYAEELNSGASIFCGKDTTEREPMISASIIKMFIMAKTYEMVEQGQINIDDVYQDMYDMITISDNYDTNRLTEYLGGGSASAGRALVTDFAARMGYPEVEHNRLMLDFNGYENYVSVRACAQLLRDIYEGNCVSEEASEGMLNILLNQTDRYYIPAGVPEGVTTAVKGGDLPNCQGDTGIVFLEGNPYVVCIITNSTYCDFNKQKIGEISGLIYNAMAENLS